METQRQLLRMTVLACLVLITTGHAGPLERKLADIRIGKVELEDVSVADVVKLLREESKTRDPDHTGVNFLLRGGEKGPAVFEERKVSLSFSNLPLADVIRYLCMAAGLQFAVEDTAVIIADEDVPLSKMETRFYQLKAGVIDTKPTKKAKPLEWNDK